MGAEYGDVSQVNRYLPMDEGGMVSYAGQNYGSLDNNLKFLNGTAGSWCNQSGRSDAVDGITPPAVTKLL